jgi:hypothetical protein
LAGNLSSKMVVQASFAVDSGEFFFLLLTIVGESFGFHLEVSTFGVLLRFNRDVFARGHRHGTGDKAGGASEDDAAPRCVRGGNADDEAGGGEDSIVGAKNGGAEPTRAMDAMVFSVSFL